MLLPYRGAGAAESLWGPSRAEQSHWPQERAQGHTGLAHPLALGLSQFYKVLVGTGEQPSAPKRSSPFFSCTSCFVCVTWDRGKWGRTPWVWGSSGLSLGPPTALSPHSTCAGTGSCQAKCLTITGSLEGTLKVIYVTQALPALCTGHICRADAQLAAPGGQDRLTPISSHL